MIKSFEDFQSLGKDSFDAYVASATAMTKGLQAIAAETADYSRKSFEKGSQVFEQAAQAKSLDKVFEAQQSFAKESYDSLLGQMNKIGELYIAAAKDAYRPFESKLAEFGFKAPK